MRWRYRTAIVHSVLSVLFVPFALCAGAAAAAEQSGEEIWAKVRRSLFESRPIQEGRGDVIQLEAPLRAEDAAVVPLALRAQIPQTPERYIKTLYLFIDKNPSPIAAIFRLTPESGRADIETRVRIEEYTYVRAVAELNDGSLHMATRYVKASGGCSAPAGKDQAAALARLGKMRLRLEGSAVRGQPSLAQLMVSHPNDSGLVFDQVSRLYAPAHFVRKVDITYGDKTILSAEVDFSISENPNFRFYFVPREGGELKATVVDSKDLQFTSSLSFDSLPAVR